MHITHRGSPHRTALSHRTSPSHRTGRTGLHTLRALIASAGILASTALGGCLVLEVPRSHGEAVSADPNSPRNMGALKIQADGMNDHVMEILEGCRRRL